MFGLVSAAPGGLGRACCLCNSADAQGGSPGDLATFNTMHAQMHPRKLAFTVDAVILATQQEKEPLSF